MARPAQSQVDAAIQSNLPIVLKRSFFGNGTVTGTVINASLNKPEGGIQVCSKTLCDLSNDNGVYKLKDIASGYQTLTAFASGFMTTTQNTNVVANTENQQDITIVPSVIEDGLKYRIVITWDPTSCWPAPDGSTCWPNDLDAHMWLEPPPVDYHIGYYFHYNPKTEVEEYWLDTGDYLLFPYAVLESWTADGYGPETLAIKSLVRDKIYYVGVFNYNQGQPGVPPISQTGTQVQVYGLGGLEGNYQVPIDMGDLNFWYVFKLDNTVNPPVITETNCIINYSNDPPQCPEK
jgi:hypothetical protein